MKIAPDYLQPRCWIDEDLTTLTKLDPTPGWTLNYKCTKSSIILFVQIRFVLVDGWNRNEENFCALAFALFCRQRRKTGSTIELSSLQRPGLTFLPIAIHMHSLTCRQAYGEVSRKAWKRKTKRKIGMFYNMYRKRRKRKKFFFRSLSTFYKVLTIQKRLKNQKWENKHLCTFIIKDVF